MMPWKDRQRRWDRVAVALLALAVAAPLAAQTDLAEASVQAGQQLRLEDVPTGGFGPSSVRGLPLDESQRATLQEALKARDYPRAEALLVKEVERNPKSRELLSALGRIFFLDGRYLNCAVAMKKAEALSPLGDHDRFTLALSYIILNHRDWARPELEKLAGLNPHDPLYPYWLGRLDYDAMQFKAAAEHLRKALDVDPSFMKAYDNLGLTYEALGQYDDAIRIYEQAIDLNRQQKSPSPWPPLNLGTLLVKLGKLDKARIVLEESLRDQPHFPKARYQMGLLLEKERKDKEAIAELSLAANYDPTYADPYYVLGRIYQRLGDKQKADTAWDTFQKLKKEKKDDSPR